MLPTIMPEASFNCVIYKSFPENHLSDAERRCRIMKKLGKKVAVLEGTLTAFCSCSCLSGSVRRSAQKHILLLSML